MFKKIKIVQVFQDINAAQSWSFNSDIRSNQEPEDQEPVQKLQIFATDWCLITANRFAEEGSTLIKAALNNLIFFN